MKRKLKILTLVLTIFVKTFSIFAEIDVTNIKELTSVLKPESEYFSPVYGALFWNSRYVENLYRHGNQQSVTVKLIKELFHVHHDEVTFDATYLPTIPATYFPSYLIGQIVGNIENFILEKTQLQLKIQKNETVNHRFGKQLKEATKELKKAHPEYGKKRLKKELTKSNQGLFKNTTENQRQKKELNRGASQLKDKFETTIRELINSFESKEEKALIKANIIKYLSSKYIPRKEQELKEYQETRNEQKIQIASELLTKAKNNLNLEQSQTEEIQNSTYLHFKEQFPILLSKSLDESDTYIPHNTVFILLTFLWKKADSKDDYLNYFKGLSGTSVNKENLFRNSKFFEKGLSKSLLRKEDYERLRIAREVNIVNNISNDLEQLAFSFLGYNLFENPFPPTVGMMGNIKYKEHIYPDCGSTSLRNFFNSLLYDPETKKFDIDLLKKLGANERLIEFYRDKYPDAKNIMTRQSHDDWAIVVSEYPEVDYCTSGICEINAGIKNMLKVVENLLSTKNLEELAAKLNDCGISMNISYLHADLDKYNKNNKITFTIKKPYIEKEFQITWLIYPGSFRILVPSFKSLAHSPSYTEAMQKLISSAQYKNEILKLIIFLGIYSDEPTIIVKNASPEMAPIYEYFFLFMQDLALPAKNLGLVEKLTSSGVLEQNDKWKELKIKLIKSMYTTFPTEGVHFQEKFFEAIFKSDLNIFDPKKEPFNIMTETQKSVAMSTMVEMNKITNYYQWIIESLPQITTDSCIERIVSSIIDKEISDNIAEQKQLATFLSSILNDFGKYFEKHQEQKASLERKIDRIKE